MNDQEYDKYESVEDNKLRDIKSPQQVSQKMMTQADIHGDDNDLDHQESATLPKSLKKPQPVITGGGSIEYIPESPEFDFEAVKSSPHFKFKKYPEAVYFGEIQNGVRNGWGVMKYNTSRVYEGEWVDDIRCGKGYERYTNNNVYVGEFK